MPATTSLALFEALEDVLVRHPVFGSSEYIRNRFTECQRSRLEFVGKQLRAGRQLLSALAEFDDSVQYTLLANTVVSCAIQHAAAQLENIGQYVFSLGHCERIFDEARAYLRNGTVGVPLQGRTIGLRRIRTADRNVWVWSETHPDDLFGRSFRLLIRQNYGDSLCAPNDDDISSLEKGAELLYTLVPSLASSALSHVHLIGCFESFGNWKGVGSSSQFRLGGTIFLSQQQIHDPWWVAEHLLHEALHQKFYEFRHTHSILNPLGRDTGERGSESASVFTPWNPSRLTKSNYWDTHRTFAAFHVYVHLALLSLIAFLQSESLESAYGPRRAMIESSKALARARYLGEQLAGACWSELGFAGSEMARWFTDVLNTMDSQPRPAGADFRLLLDLYERERRRVQSSQEFVDVEHRSDLWRRLESCVRYEIDAFRRLLIDIDAPDYIAKKFAAAIDGDAGVTSLPAVRKIISECLIAVAPDDCPRPANREIAAVGRSHFIRQFVEEASDRLFVALEGLPAAVVAAKQRAKKTGFYKACLDPVGRLLATLAAAAPKHGRILEIGTGVGVGTAWICAGLDQREDVEVVSVEVDRGLSDSARTWDWPSCVQILTADIVDLVGSIGKFDLVFADAAPSKYEYLELTLSLIRVGALLLVDDLRTNAGRTAANAKKIALRDRLLHDANLQAVELDFSSGVILAVATRSVT